MFCELRPEMSESILSAVKSVVLPEDSSTSPLTHPLHSSGDANSINNQILRVVAEIQTRTSLVLSQSLKDVEFAKKFITECGNSINILKSLAKDCHDGSRLSVVESHCHRLRMLYRFVYIFMSIFVYKCVSLLCLCVSYVYVICVFLWINKAQVAGCLAEINTITMYLHNSYCKTVFFRGSLFFAVGRL